MELRHIAFIVRLFYSGAATSSVLQEKVFLEISQNSQENTCISFLIKLQVNFASEFCEISNNIFFTEHLRTTASFSCMQRVPDRTTHRIL